MKRSLLIPLLLATFFTYSNTIVVRNIEELHKANLEAKPGDVIILKNGEWKDVTIRLNCKGTKEKPVIFKAETAGKVTISGNSMLKIGGSFIVVDGLYFINGFTGDNAVIDFRISKNQLANNCRVTNCVIDNFNNRQRMDDNNWVLFYGKNNQLDHCSFINKKNMGVLLAVILDDERSRQNFHSIDHNYFGLRIPLASNGGEIIRVGVSQHCQFSSNTQITDNYFEHCDGEAEVISIKSGENTVRGNLFKECQGSLVLRHGDNNTVENNIFLGNDKEGTGGVRVVNKGQWIVNNLFYKCRGVDFRSPLAVMNGIPNSPAHRYVQVTDAMIANNTFYNCSPISLCEGSDTERTLAPQRAYLLNNIFYNNRDSLIYRAYDNTSGISFLGNEINQEVEQSPGDGFTRTSFTFQKNDNMPFIVTTLAGKAVVTDSLQLEGKKRLKGALSDKGGFQDLALAKKIQSNAYTACGAKWYAKYKSPPKALLKVNCKNAEEVYRQLERKDPVMITLTGQRYELNKPFLVSKPVVFTGNTRTVIKFFTDPMQSAFLISGNGHLTLKQLHVSGSMMKAVSFISNDSSGLADHYSLVIAGCTFTSFDRSFGCANIFNAYKSMVADSIVVSDCHFINNNTNGFMLSGETDNKGYYSAAKISVKGNEISSLKGILFSIYRGGNDESTLGPQFVFTGNVAWGCNTTDSVEALIQLTGVQRSTIADNRFSDCNPRSVDTDNESSRPIGGKLLHYTDYVRAIHILQNNLFISSGAIHINRFVKESGNSFEKMEVRYY